MDISGLLEKRKRYEAVKDSIPEATRTSRLLMNYQLMAKGFLPVYIAKEDRLTYYNALDQYAAHGRLDDFADMIALLEEKKLDKYLELAAIQEQEPPTQTM